MNVSLISMKIESFKGIKSKTFTPDGHNAIISGKNGKGKTTFADAFNWVLRGKDSEEKSDFSIMPLDKDNNIIKGLSAGVEIVIALHSDRTGAETHTIRRVMKERIVKNEVKGYTTDYWIDEVPKKQKEFIAEIADMIPEDEFRILTDPQYFCEKLHWSDQREMLTRMTPTFKEPEEFKPLIKAMAGRLLDDYRKIIVGRRKTSVDERDEINPRVDEQQKILKQYAGDQDATLDTQRAGLIASVTKLDDQRTELLNSEKERTKKIDRLNALKTEKSNREAALRNDTVGHQPLHDERAKINDDIEAKELVATKLTKEVTSTKAAMSLTCDDLEQCQKELDKIRTDYLDVTNADFSGETCSACGQTLPPDSIAKMEERRDGNAKYLAAVGNGKKAEKRSIQVQIDTQKAELQTVNEALDKANIELRDANTFASGQIAKIDEMLKNRVKIEPENDPAWKQLVADIAEAETAIGDPLTDQLAAIEAKRTEKTDSIATIDKTLSAADTMTAANNRIKELTAREKELGAIIAELDGQLNEISRYQMYQSTAIETAVNDKFEFVKFKLFNVLLNESVEPCCVALLDGKPYPDCSYGERKLIGADIINVMSKHFDLVAPVFVDNSESLTYSLPLPGQVICLQVKECELDIHINIPEAPKEVPTVVDEVSSSPSKEVLDKCKSRLEPKPECETQYYCKDCKKPFKEPSGESIQKCPHCYSLNFEEL